MTIAEIRKKYYNKIDALDLELIIAHEIGKTREFVLAHPEHKLTNNQELKTKNLLTRRVKHEPLAYILGHKEFFGLDFKVNKQVLIPRPETEMLVGLTLKELQAKSNKPKTTVIDIGTGSGNIIISLAKNLKAKNKFIAVDISAQALKIAKHNAKFHKVDKKIKFIRSDLLSNRKIFSSSAIQQFNHLTIIANLPYLSSKIYHLTSRDIKNFEPKSALLSGIDGLDHYRKLLQQIKKLTTDYKLKTTNFLEFSPKQKPALQRLVKSVLPDAKIKFRKDLAGKWRTCQISL